MISRTFSTQARLRGYGIEAPFRREAIRINHHSIYCKLSHFEYQSERRIKSTWTKQKAFLFQEWYQNVRQHTFSFLTSDYNNVIFLHCRTHKKIQLSNLKNSALAKKFQRIYGNGAGTGTFCLTWEKSDLSEFDLCEFNYTWIHSLMSGLEKLGIP